MYQSESGILYFLLKFSFKSTMDEKKIIANLLVIQYPRKPPFLEKKTLRASFSYPKRYNYLTH